MESFEEGPLPVHALTAEAGALGREDQTDAGWRMGEAVEADRMQRGWFIAGPPFRRAACPDTYQAAAAL